MSIILSIALIGTTKLKATTNDGWLYNVKNNIQNTHFYDLGSGTNYTWYDSVTSPIQLDESGNNWFFFHPEKAHTIASNGLMYSFYSGTSFKTGYLYNLQYYACSSAKVNYDTVDTTLFLGSNATQNAQRINNISFQTSSVTGLSSNPSDSSPTNFNYCHQVNVLFVPSVDSLQWLGMRYTAKNSSFSTYLYEFGYNINELGLYTDTVKNIIENSNGNVVESVDKVNETLNKNHEYNNNESVSTEEEKNKFNNFEQEEDNLRNGLNLNIEDTEITINPEANTFIWNIVNRLRGMSGKIVLLFTSVLSLGIMKMILGR